MPVFSIIATMACIVSFAIVCYSVRRFYRKIKVTNAVHCVDGFSLFPMMIAALYIVGTLVLKWHDSFMGTQLMVEYSVGFVVPVLFCMIANMEMLVAYNESVLFSPFYETDLRTLEIRKVKRRCFHRVSISLENDIRRYNLNISVDKSENLLKKIGAEKDASTLEK